MYCVDAVAVNLNQCSPPAAAILPSSHTAKASVVAVAALDGKGAVLDALNAIW
jgi:hypothetical protein